MKKRNGKLTKKEIVKRIYFRAHHGLTASKYSIAYIARRIDKTVEDTFNFIKYLERNNVVKVASYNNGSVEFK